MQCLNIVDKNNDKIRIKKIYIYTLHTYSHTPIPLKAYLRLCLRNRDFKSKALFGKSFIFKFLPKVFFFFLGGGGLFLSFLDS
jgi:hypothetical protein